VGDNVRDQSSVTNERAIELLKVLENWVSQVWMRVLSSRFRIDEFGVSKIDEIVKQMILKIHKSRNLEIRGYKTRGSLILSTSNRH
jgi:hypothetical protein